MEKYLKYKNKYLELKNKYNFINDNNLFYDLNKKYSKESFKTEHKNILGTKAYVAIIIGDLTFVSCHLPIDTSIKDESNYLGNNLRINALKKISDDLRDHKNIIVAGDLNFRFVNELKETDQLNELLLNFKTFKEFGKLDIKTCKLKTCK
jgi:hypothetical protein